MKKLFAAVVMATAAFSAQADTGFCEIINKVANQMMEGRQVGVPLIEQIQINKTIPDPKFRKAFDLLAMSAYEQPRYSTKEHQSKAIAEFSNKAMLACLKAS